MTRLYFPAEDAAGVSPAFDAAWTATGGAVRRRLAHAKGRSYAGAGTAISWTPGEYALDRQYVSDPMQAGVAFGPAATTLASVLVAREVSPVNNVATVLIGARVVSRDGSTVRATLLAVTPFSVSELSTAFGVRLVASAYAVTGTWTTLAGDRLVVELGYTDTVGASPSAYGKWGEAGQDAATDENLFADAILTPMRVGWMDVSTTPAFEGVSTDPVALVKSLLSAGWAPANTDGVTPTFRSPDDREELRSFAPGSDVVKVYSGRPRGRRRLDGRYDFSVWEASVYVHGTTAGASGVAPKAHAERMMQEAERIVNASKNDPDAYWEFAYVDSGEQPEEFPTKNKFLLNVALQRWGAVPA